MSAIIFERTSTDIVLIMVIATFLERVKRISQIFSGAQFRNRNKS